MNVRAQIKVCNEDMRQARSASGLTLKELSEASGVSVNHICAMQSFRFKGNGSPQKWRERADALSIVLRVPSEVLAPDALTGESIEPIVSVQRMSPEGLLAVKGRLDQRAAAQLPDAGLNREDLSDKLNEAMHSGISSRSAKVLRLRYGLDGEREHSLRETAKKLSLSSERVRQLELGALRDMRHGEHAHGLRILT